MRPFIWQDSTVDDVTNSSKKTSLSEHAVYWISANTDLWFKVDVTGGSASIGNGSHFMASGESRLVSVALAGESNSSLFLHYIRDSANGKISISKVVPR